MWKIFESFVKSVLSFLFGLVKIKPDGKMWGKIMQFVKFCVVGCLNAAVFVIVSYIVMFFFEINGATGTIFGISEFYVQFATVTAFFFKVLNSYFWNGRYVFPDPAKKTAGEHIFRYLKLCLSYSVSLLISLLLNATLWAAILIPNGLDKLCSPLNEIITIPLNFILDKFFAFAKKKTK